MGCTQFSGTGGATDYAYGAFHSKGGKGIVALTSTAKHGTVSRIVPTLTPERGGLHSAEHCRFHCHGIRCSPASSSAPGSAGKSYDFHCPSGFPRRAPEGSGPADDLVIPSIQQSRLYAFCKEPGFLSLFQGPVHGLLTVFHKKLVDFRKRTAAKEAAIGGQGTADALRSAPIARAFV